MKSSKKTIIATVTILYALLNATTIVYAAESKSIASQPLNGNHTLLVYADNSDTDNKDAHSHKKHHHGKHNWMSKLDVDKDGKISKEEFLKYNEAKFEKKDLNNDGFIDKEEMHEMMKKHMHGHHEHEKKEMGHKTHEDKQE